ncbi:hypothetical protein DL96DRAFT_1622926 [Flagelloscypha sp. PMI_526]|nr:hypothetical protein DL96DRAFT_1622926 [Flagelloscypha sp. PMI_526]
MTSTIFIRFVILQFLALFVYAASLKAREETAPGAHQNARTTCGSTGYGYTAAILAYNCGFTGCCQNGYIECIGTDVCCEFGTQCYVDSYGVATCY